MSAATPPAGQPGYDLHDDQRGRIVGSAIAIITITIVFVFLRFLSRKLSRAGFWWDDHLTLLALIFSNACAVVWLCEIPNGFGRHIYIWEPDERARKVRAWFKGFLAFELLFHTATTLSKFAILAFYYRIFPEPRFRRLVIWVAAFCVIYLIAIDATFFCQCRPINYLWNRVDNTAHGQCFDVNVFFQASGAVNVFLNFVLFVLPIPLLWRLRTTFKQQLVLTAVFTLAGFVVVISVIWIVVLSNIEQEDVTWNYVNAGIWSALEPNMAVVCACIPSLRPLVTIITQGAFHQPLMRNTGDTHDRLIRKHKRKISRVMSPESAFSNLSDMDDLQPLGRDVLVRGGKQDDDQPTEQDAEIPRFGITVHTEIEISTCDRLDYHDRLY